MGSGSDHAREEARLPHHPRAGTRRWAPRARHPAPARAGHPRGPAGVLLRVSDSKFPREVPVLWRWEQPLVDLVETREPEDLALGVARTTTNPNYLNYTISRTAPEAGLRPNSERLRNTWLLHHLASGTPLGPLSVAAGLETFRTFEKLAHLLPEPTTTDVRRAMRRPLRAV